MDIEIITRNYQLDIYGFGEICTNKDYVGSAFNLMGKMWQAVKSNNLKNRGLNIIVYEHNERVFAGVELYEMPQDSTGLELKSISLSKYACHKHFGSYSLIKQVGQKMTDELTKQGFEVILPYIEIYGHWTSNESKLETELLMCLK